MDEPKSPRPTIIVPETWISPNPLENTNNNPYVPCIQQMESFPSNPESPRTTVFVPDAWPSPDPFEHTNSPYVQCIQHIPSFPSHLSFNGSQFVSDSSSKEVPQLESQKCLSSIDIKDKEREVCLKHMLVVEGLPKLENHQVWAEMLPRIFPGSQYDKNVLPFSANPESALTTTILDFSDDSIMRKTHESLQNSRVYELPNENFYKNVDSYLTKSGNKSILFRVNKRYFAILPEGNVLTYMNLPYVELKVYYEERDWWKRIKCTKKLSNKT